MLNTKKMFTEHLLTLVLTLSLLRVDPENYLDLQLGGGRLAGGVGDGDWQLELLAAPHYSNRSYVSRKFLPPIIEDLSRFEQPFIEQNYRGLQTYLLNIQANENSSASAGTGGVGSGGAIAEERPSSPLPPAGANALPAAHNVTVPPVIATMMSGFDVDAEDIFLNGNLFEESTSVLEQNLADLNDYSTIMFENPVTKFDPDAAVPDIEDTIERARSLVASSASGVTIKQEPEEEGATATTSTSLAPDAKRVPVGLALNQTFKREDTADEEGVVKDASLALNHSDRMSTQRKHLVSTDLDSETEEDEKKVLLSLAADAALVVAVASARSLALPHQEMDLIEVLWKQDVDLGFTLTNAPATSATAGTRATANAAGAEATTKPDSEDDLEKLKALLEIKNDKNADTDKQLDATDDGSLVDPWAGLSYTIDTETGEYVLNSSDIDNSLPPPLADLFLEQELTLPDLGGTVEDTIAEIKSNDRDGIQQHQQQDREIAEVHRIEQELQVSVDDLYLSSASTSSTSGGHSSSALSETEADLVASTIAVNGGGDADDDDPNVTAAAAAVASSSSASEENLDAPATDELEDLLCDMMIQTSSHFQHSRQNTQGYGHGMSSFRQTTTGAGGYHHHHHHHHHHHQQSRVPLTRAVSMEQRWQDLANLLSFPPGMGVGMGVADMPPAHPSHAHPHYPAHYPSYQPSGGLGPQHGQYHHPAVLQNASLADIAPAQPHYGANLGSAVATSMHLTNSTSETDAGSSGYKMDPEMMYYSNASTSEMNHTDGFLNSILNDEDLQLMDIAVNEGMYTMRMLEHNGTGGGASNNSSMLGVSAASNLMNHSGAGAAGAAIGGGHHHLSLMAGSTGGAIGGGNHLHSAMNVSALVSGSSVTTGSSGASASSGAGGAGAVGQTTVPGSNGGPLAGSGTPGDRLDASSDSAVSSMGSERVPSLSDGEWGDGGSDSAQEYHHGTKYGGPFDYSYNQTASGGPGNRMGEPHGSRQAPLVAQKKQHMFAKRYFEEQNTTIPAIHPSPGGPNGGANATNGSGSLDGTGSGGGGGGGPTGGGILPPATIKYEYDYMNVLGAGAAPSAIGAQLEATTKQEDQHQLHHHNGTGQPHHEASTVAAAAAAAAALTDMKYSYGIEFQRNHHATPGAMGRNGTLQPQDMIHHNHTYTLPYAATAGTNHPGTKSQTRDKSRSLSSAARKAEEEHLTRDEKRARALQIPIPVHDIINLPMDEFNERLSKYDLSETQLSLIRDIRRRGKNKVAAQNCRKRKLDQIVTLADEVKDMKMRKERLLRDREMVLSEHKKIRDKFSVLYRHVFQNLRDADGNPYSQEHYSLQQSADGAVVLVPRSSERPTQSNGQLNGVGSSGTTGLHHSHHSLHHPHAHLHHHQQHQQQQQQHLHHSLTHHLPHHSLVGGGGGATAAISAGGASVSAMNGGVTSNGIASNHGSSSATSSSNSSNSTVAGGITSNTSSLTGSAVTGVVNQRSKE
uniref:Putative bzip transcription factor nrf1 n=1 Tax=Anopheles darlingi TaxID=43151 RepID=A0A2M4DKG2_ANODA